MISLDNLKTILNAIKYLLTDYPKKKDIPTKLPNPNPLTFTGTVTGIYDGSEALTVEIPSGDGGSGSVPKPLTFDYMPAGYPTKSVQTTTLMAEQELAFVSEGGSPYMASLTEALELVEGQTYTVKWDGTEYECVCVVFHSMHTLGNLSIMGTGDDTGEPFLYVYDENSFITLDTSPTHTIGVKRIVETVTPMAEEFLPDISVPFIVNVWATNRQQTVFECDKTISEIQAAIESKTSITLRYRDSVSNESDFVIYNLSQFRIANNEYEFQHIELNTTGIRLRTFYIRLENGNMVISRTANNIVTFENTTA